ncbi:DUF4371 domain-containing protein [Trichonephila clavipes]|nr:DUF4371 domain-containing protein [Trichonephila clavipes]
MTQPGTSAKRSKTYHYHNEWEDDFFFVMVKKKCVCLSLICNSSVALRKTANDKRHFKTIHLKYATDFPIGSELRKVKVHELKWNLHLQQSLFTRPGTKAKAVTLASFKMTEALIKRKKPFEEGELIKEALCKA